MSRRSAILICVGLTVIVAFAADTVKEREDSIKDRVSALQADKLSLDNDIQGVLDSSISPLLMRIEAMTAEANSIHDATVSLCEDENVSLSEKERVLGVVDAFCDANGIRYRKMMVDIMSFTLDISKLEYEELSQ